MQIKNCFYFLSDVVFLQVEHAPTHERNFTDLIFVSHDNFVCDVNVDIPFSTSDHSSVEVTLQSFVSINVNDFTHVPNNKPSLFGLQ